MELKIKRPDDWHLHLRDGDMLKAVLPHSSNHLGRAIIMPNLIPPLVETKDIEAYRGRILAALPEGHKFQPLMTAYLSDTTNPADLIAGHNAGIISAVKLYPANATTNSAQGVSSMDKVYHVLEAMQEADIPLCIHGEVTHADVDIFDRESRFVEEILAPLVARFPQLRVISEHVTTKEAAQFVMESSDKVAATMTPQHLLLDRNDLLVGGIRPHNYCLPILKRNIHREALVKAATSGNESFFMGTDSAPHATDKKENCCGCAGAFNSMVALSVYAEVFEKANALDKLEAFTSLNGPKFYKQPVNEDTITLVKAPYDVPEKIDVPNIGTVTPFLAGKTLDWSVK